MEDSKFSDLLSAFSYIHFYDHPNRSNSFASFSFIAHCIVDKVVPNDPSLGLFCIFDGHGGRQVSDYAAERFPIEMRKELMKNPSDLSNCITDVYNKIN